MRFFLFLLVFLFGSTSFSQEWTGAIVKVYATNGGVGSGVHVGNGYVLTAAHVTEGQPVRLLWPSGTVSSGQYISRSINADLSAVVTTHIGPSLPLGTEYPTTGDSVYGVGYGPGQLSVRTTQLRGYKSSGHRFSTEPFSVPGDSGGALVYKDRLVGIITGGELYSRNGPAIDSHGPCCNELHRFLGAIGRRLCPDERCPNPYLVPTTPQPQPIVGYPIPATPIPSRPIPSQPIPSQPIPTTPRPVPAVPETIPVTPVIDIDYEKLATLVVSAMADDPRFKTKCECDVNAIVAQVVAQTPKPTQPVIDYDRIVAEVTDQIAQRPMTIRIVNGQGKVISSQSQPLGGTFSLQFVPKN